MPDLDECKAMLSTCQEYSVTWNVGTVSDKNRLAKNLRLARVAAGLTQIDAAKLVGKSRQTINSWEREAEDAASPDDSDLQTLADAYGTTRAELRYGASSRVSQPDAIPYEARHARNLPLAVREYLAEVRLRLTKGGATEEEIDEAFDLLRSPEVFSYFSGGKLNEFNETDVLDGMRSIVENVIIPRLKQLGRKIP